MAALSKILALLMPSLCTVVAPGFQSEGLGELFLELRLHMKHSFHLFIPGVGKLPEIKGYKVQ